jgi:hypothetical protein
MIVPFVHRPSLVFRWLEGRDRETTRVSREFQLMLESLPDCVVGAAMSQDIRLVEYSARSAVYS